jgi:two-component system response regulator HydG
MATQPKILLVDDDARMRTAVLKVLSSEGHSVVSVGSGSEAIHLLRTHDIVLVISDLVLPDLDGTAVLKAARELRPEIEVVMITGHGSVEKAVEAMRLGAYDFIEKPIDSVGLCKVVAKALEKQRLTAENRQLRRQLQQGRSLEALIGNSPAMQAVKTLIRQIAATNVTVLIQGESGTGKEIVADAIHNLSDRRDKALLKVSCAAIPETLLESELFGYERGAFTGATAAKPGKFELAAGGTLLLDEIAEMSPPLQAKLLRVLQDGQFQRLGGTRTLQADVRLLAATHANIMELIEGEQFRHDLYYRINTVQISLPAVRARREDVPLLARHFLAKFSMEMRRGIGGITPKAMDQLSAHSWPGNVRELEHVIQRAVALATGDTIAEFAFPQTACGMGESTAADGNGPRITIPIGTTVGEATKRLVDATVEQCGGNKLQAARILGIPPRTMYRHFSEPKR